MIKSNSFFTKIFLLIVTVFMLAGGALSYTLISVQESSLVDVIYTKAKTIAKSVSLVSADAMITEDYAFLVEHIEKVLEDNKDIVFTVITKERGESLYNAPKSWKVLSQLPPKLNALLSDKEHGGMVEDIFENKKVYLFTYPIVFSGVKWGWISIGYSLKQYQENMQKLYLTSLVLFIFILFVSIVLSYTLTKWIVSPILRLNLAVKRVAEGRLDTKVEISSHDEVGELAKSFNVMIEELQNSDTKLRHMNEELEHRVEQRTEELENLNRNLDKRVKEEVQKRSQQEQLLVQQSRFAAMGEMIGNIAHQWRQPLNALSLLLQNVQNAYEMDMLDKEYIQRTVDKGTLLTNNMSKTIDDFRDFFKPNKQIEVFSISKAIDTTLEIIGASFTNHMIGFEKDLQDEYCSEGFSSEFSQVLLNILNNAKDALVEKDVADKKILFKVSADEDDVKIDIEDNAGGIPKAILQKVFDPYFTTKEEGKGTGIGLYMSKTIIEHNMRGKLTASNTENGARFTIMLKKVSCDKKEQKEGKTDAKL
jgi:nitrogen fixation/metabolism regulation signal transduction histidine kinase